MAYAFFMFKERNALTVHCILGFGINYIKNFHILNFTFVNHSIKN